MASVANNCAQRYQWARVGKEDYASAFSRTRLSKRRSLSRSRYQDRELYELASRLISLTSPRPRVEERFSQELLTHIKRWKTETQHWSSLSKTITHSSYLRIIALAGHFRNNEVERVLLRELETEPDHWFAALAAITGENPVLPTHDFDDAVSAWLEWGKVRKLR